MFHRAITVCEDPEASRYVWETAFHWYVGTDPTVAGLLHDAFPDKAVFFSEGCNYPFSWKTFNDWKWGENYGRSMIGDFNNWARGWTDWNILVPAGLTSPVFHKDFPLIFNRNLMRLPVISVG